MAMRADSTDKASTRRATASQAHGGEHLDEPPDALYIYPLSPAARHARDLLQRVCDKGVLLDAGRVTASGPIRDVLRG